MSVVELMLNCNFSSIIIMTVAYSLEEIIKEFFPFLRRGRIGLILRRLRPMLKISVSPVLALPPLDLCSYFLHLSTPLTHYLQKCPSTLAPNSLVCHHYRILYLAQTYLDIA